MLDKGVQRDVNSERNESEQSREEGSEGRQESEGNVGRKGE